MKKLLCTVNSLVALSLLVSSPSFAQRELWTTIGYLRNGIAIFTSADNYTNCLPSGCTVRTSIYFVVLNPTNADGSVVETIQGFEFAVSISSPGQLVRLYEEFPQAAVNLGNSADPHNAAYIVSFSTPQLVVNGLALLLRWEILPLSVEPYYFYLPPSIVSPSAPQQISIQSEGVNIDCINYPADIFRPVFAIYDWATDPEYKPFIDIGASLPGVHEGAVQWGDYDNDGDLDLVVAGDTGAGYISRIYRNNGGGSFTDIGAGLPGISLANAAWGDYDNDGDLDLVLSGETVTGHLSRLYRNDSGAFVDANAGLAAGFGSRLAWGDYDNDGDLDLFLATNTGDWTNMVLISRIYRNDGSGAFVAMDCGLPGLWGGSVSWGDYDSDGHLDLFLTGNSGGSFLSRVYRNCGDWFANTAEFTGTWAGAGEWGDYDGDGDLDILQTGATSYDLTRVCRNDGGTFTEIEVGVAGMPPLQWSSATWGDCDNDGDLDILLTGYCAPMVRYVSGVFVNTDGRFIDTNAGLVPADYNGVIPAAWGDYDNDGRLDIAASSSGHVLRIYRNPDYAFPTQPNSAPTAPHALEVWSWRDQITFSWSAATDAETPAVGLSYNLRIGTTPGGNEITSAMADGASGFRRVVARGNVPHGTSWTATLPPGHYYWSVQAVDGAFAGGPFAEEMMYASDVVDSPVPREYALHAISPNPFNPATTIAFSLPEPTQVKLAVYDLSGRMVRVLVDEPREAGRHEEIWNGSDDRGQQVASGVYVCRMEAGAFRETKRMTMVK